MVPLSGEVRACHADGGKGNDVTFAEAIFWFMCVIFAISILWSLGYVLRNTRQDRMNERGGLGDLDELRWNVWTPGLGWPPVTCWQGCANLHRDDWWREHVHQTCWAGCKDLHRDDWWRAYLDQAN